MHSIIFVISCVVTSFILKRKPLNVKTHEIMLFSFLKKSETTTKEINGLNHDQVALSKTFRGTTQVCVR